MSATLIPPSEIKQVVERAFQAAVGSGKSTVVYKGNRFEVRYVGKRDKTVSASRSAKTSSPAGYRDHLLQKKHRESGKKAETKTSVTSLGPVVDVPYLQSEYGINSKEWDAISKTLLNEAQEGKEKGSSKIFKGSLREIIHS